jgi:hypothetical protein
MKQDFARLAEEAIRLELNVAELYILFHELFPEDADFWWKLSLEEKHHAAILRSGISYFAPVGKFPEELLSDPLQEIIAENNRITSLTKEYRANPSSREKAFRSALELEMLAGELHFQEFMAKKACSKLEEIFQKLNAHDKDHMDRIISYMNEHDIPLEEI